VKMLAVLFLSALAANSSAANPVDIYTRYFAGTSGGKPCYARYYDRAHMNAHQTQTVRRIVVDFDQARRDDKLTKNTSAEFHAGFGFMLKRPNEWYGQELFLQSNRRPLRLLSRCRRREHREPYESRGSRTDLGAPGGESPPGDSTGRDLRKRHATRATRINSLP
jgi:hypothetical protein